MDEGGARKRRSKARPAQFLACHMNELSCCFQQVEQMHFAWLGVVVCLDAHPNYMRPLSRRRYWPFYRYSVVAIRHPSIPQTSYY